MCVYLVGECGGRVVVGLVVGGIDDVVVGGVVVGVVV